MTFFLLHWNGVFFCVYKNNSAQYVTTLQTVRFPSGLHISGNSANFFKALHGRLAGRFKPPLAGRCNDFAPSRQKNCHRQKQPSRPGPRKKEKKRPVPSRRKKKKTTPFRLGKKKKPPRKKTKNAPSRHEQQNTPPRGWKLETNTTACLFFSLSCCAFISYYSLVRSIF